MPLRTRRVENIWQAAAELGIDIANPQIAELLARPYIQRRDIWKILGKPNTYRSSVARAVDNKDLRKADLPFPGIEVFEPREVLEWLLNRDERWVERDQERLRRQKDSK